MWKIKKQKEENSQAECRKKPGILPSEAKIIENVSQESLDKMRQAIDRSTLMVYGGSIVIAVIMSWYLTGDMTGILPVHIIAIVGSFLMFPYLLAVCPPLVVAIMIFLPSLFVPALKIFLSFVGALVLLWCIGLFFITRAEKRFDIRRNALENHLTTQ